MSGDSILRLDGITKRFGAITANEDVSIDLARGEVLALLGENGAGKTTLMNILFGHYMPDEGSVTVDGRALRLGVPRDAIAAGVGMVHQHFTLAPNLTVLENVMTGTESLLAPRSAKGRARQRLAALAERFGLAVDPDAHVSALSVGQQQRVEILKALYNDARILILDEPTAVLTRPEAERLFETLRDMARQGLSIIFISHKLHEVMAGADRVVVLRAGRVTAERRTGATTQAELAELMVGRRVERPVRQPTQPGPLVIEARGVDVPMPGGTPLRGADFTLRGSEILGIIGVSGNGQTTLAHLLSGLATPSAGQIRILGQDARGLTARTMAAMGVGRIPEDRNTEGAVGSFPIWQNAVLERLSDPRFARLGIVRRGAARRFASDIAARFDLRGGGPDTETRQLSGGNMQKLILGRNLVDAPRVLVAAQPTRGLDEGAIAAVHAELLAAARGGTGVVLISEDLDEVIALADRAQAIVNGRLSPPVDAAHLDARRLGLMMAGVWEGLADAV
ncbi:sugar ABC transporter ATP-binding protein [Meridianimarinicoccus roseus]|uniref:Sugar ABC transporter ATP-binding protein n=1 Tax=Meridianimarinicoccus roseus TaxID=2072018 RepID=A0A2V2LB10_9RHOB|nr:ABC transporter ATP-binding protein [Meridianimarinicoccus roseus]PWR02680.1 sugar ABC transporter ATP-binding protein [Meridianimarinicoccus roseus]